MSNYARADTAVAWYQDDYPGATIRPNCGVLHTTEGTTLPGYSGGADAPNYTAIPDLAEKRLRWFAHFPDEKSSRALVNAPGGVETNTLNTIQVELVGTCAPATHGAWTKAKVPHIYWPEAPDWALRDLARFLLDMKDRHGIPLTGPAPGQWRPYPESYGPGGQRFSAEEWRAFQGWCGHQHVPENVHGDPGAFPFAKLVNLAEAMEGGGTKGGHKPDAETPRWDRIWELADYIFTHSSDPEKRDAARTIRKAAARWSAQH